MTVRRTARAAAWGLGPPLAPVATTQAGRAVRVTRQGTKARAARKGPASDAIGEYVERGRKLLLGELDSAGGTVGDLVGAWAAIHEELHGIAPVELFGEWASIHYAARRVLVDYLASDFDAALDLIRWAAKRAKTVRNGERLKWRFLFNASTVSDFRVST